MATTEPLAAKRQEFRENSDSGSQRNSEIAEREVELYIGTCQNCGAYWDVRQYSECPARYGTERTVCGGYIG